MGIHKSFRLIEEAAERGNESAEAAKQWIDDVIQTGFDLLKSGRVAFDAMAGFKLAGSDPAERVAEALAVWIEESNPLEFAEMTATRYQVNSLDCSASGMERLRYQREFILIAYPSTDSTPFELCRQWIEDLNGAAYPDGFCYEAAEQAIRQYCDDNAERIQTELDGLEAVLIGELEDCDESPACRLYVEDLHAEAAEAREEARTVATLESH
jgi:hypothetical protein